MLKIALVPSYEPDFRLKDLVIELINQQFQVIVVNDGSPDNSQDIIDKYVKNTYEEELNLENFVTSELGCSDVVSNSVEY